MDKRMKQNFMLVAAGVILYAAVMHLNYVMIFLKDIAGLFLPIFLGLTIAFVLSVPMNGFAKIIDKLSVKMSEKIFKKRGFKLKEKTVNAISLLLTIICILLIFVLVGKLAIPEIVESVKSIAATVNEQWPKWAAVLKKYNIDTKPISDWLQTLQLENIVHNVLSGAGAFFDVLVGTATSTISVFATIGISIVIMFYMLVSKKELQRQGRKLMYAYLKKEVAEKIEYIIELTYDTFSKFLSGQCLEAVILGVLIFIAFTIFRLPYAGLIAILTAIFSFIPYIGAFLACGIGVVLTLISSPQQAIMCFIVYQVVQFIENQFIYPYVVGNSVGLSPLLTLLAVLIGGNMFGVVGMIFFIPFVAVIYTLLRENTNKKLKQKNIKIQS